MFGKDLTRELIAIVNPSDLDIILKGLAILAILKIFNAPRLFEAPSPYAVDTNADTTIIKSKRLATFRA